MNTTILYVAFVFFGDLATCERFVEGREIRQDIYVQCELVEIETASTLAPLTSPRPRSRP